ncbi:MAG: hypothetical protein V3T88_02395 [Nitrosomonadaceae bacterium]
MSNANWIEETTTTTGTGTVTLAGRATERVPLSGAFADAAVVRYDIKASNGDRESGFGTFTLSGTTLSRDTIIETWIESTATPDNSNPAALTLPSGTHTVIVTNDANASFPAPLGLGVADRVLSAHYGWFAGSTGAVVVADRQYALPFLLNQPLLVDSLGMALTTGVDASTTRLGLSRMVDGLPIDMIFDVTVATTTTQSNTFTSSSVTAQLIRPGWYFIHLLSDATISPTTAFGNSASIGWTPLKKMNTTTRAGPAAYLFTSAVAVSGTFDAPETITSVTTDAKAWEVFLVK